MTQGTLLVYVPYPNTQAWNFIPRGSGIIGIPSADPDYLSLGIAEPGYAGKPTPYVARIVEAAGRVYVGSLIPVGSMHRIGAFDPETKTLALDLGADECLKHWLAIFDLTERDLKL